LCFPAFFDFSLTPTAATAVVQATMCLFPNYTMQVLENDRMGVVRLRRALQQRIVDQNTASTTGTCTATGDGSYQRLVQANDIVEGLKDAGMSPLSVLDATKV